MSLLLRDLLLMMCLGRLNSFLWGLVAFVAISLDASGAKIRSSVNEIVDTAFWVAVDFDVRGKGHITAPVGKGKSVAPSFNWKNAEILKTVWPEHVDLPPDGTYKGYDKNFSVLFLISQKDKAVPVTCNVFYVLCDDACYPVSAELQLVNDGQLRFEEINKLAPELAKDTNNLVSFIVVLCMALLGGVILNFMPCIFPVLSVKVFNIIKNSAGERRVLQRQGLAFMLGCTSAFLSIGIFLYYMKQVGTSLGWGFYMQNVVFVECLFFIFLFCALYFFGIFRMPNFAIVSKKEHGLYVQSFLNGFLTSVASGVCVGPFVGVAVGAALMYEHVLLASLIFAGLGIGMALPFSAVCFIPKLGKMLPKPGKWMGTFKEFMGFAMLFSCLWILWILSSQITIAKLIVVVAVSIFVSMFMWMFHKFSRSKVMQICSGTAVFLSMLLVMICAGNNSKEIYWTEFSNKQLGYLKEEKSPVFVNVTASWCMTCGLNSFVFEDESVVDAFKKYNVKAIKADWSKKNDDITEFLFSHSANSIPFNVLYKPNGEMIVFPTLLSADDIISELKE